MPLRTARLLLLAALTFGAVASATQLALAETVDVEVSETVKGKAADGLKASVAIAAEHSCGSVVTDLGATAYELKVCRETGDVYTFEVNRTARGKDGTSTRLRMTSKLAAGKRAVIGKVALGDVATELAAEVR
jgi:hypothetical protein